MSEMRMDKFLSHALGITRTESKKLLQTGRVRIGERPANTPAQKLDPACETVFVDDRPVAYEPYRYIMLYKPAGCITATRDSRQKTVMDCLPKEQRRDLFPVGRLDRDTEGLLLLTNDGALAHRLLSPANHVPKTYYARVAGSLGASEQEAFWNGLKIDEKKPTAPARLQILHSGKESEAQVTVTEGRFHQVRRMFETVHMPVLYLKRLSMGALVLDENLKPGQWRFLTENERKILREDTDATR